MYLPWFYIYVQQCTIQRCAFLKYALLVLHIYTYQPHQSLIILGTHWHNVKLSSYNGPRLCIPIDKVDWCFLLSTSRTDLAAYYMVQINSSKRRLQENTFGVCCAMLYSGSVLNGNPVILLMIILMNWTEISMLWKIHLMRLLEKFSVKYDQFVKLCVLWKKWMCTAVTCIPHLFQIKYFSYFSL